MTCAMDFLPARYHRATGQRRTLTWLVVLAGCVGCGIVLTEAALQYRLSTLRTTQRHASRQADAATMRAQLAASLQAQQRDLLDELAVWAAPLRTRPVSLILDGVLVSRPADMLLERLHWDGAGLGREGVQQRLELQGLVGDIGGLVRFLEAIQELDGIPGLQIEQSGLTEAHADRPWQRFKVGSVAPGGGGP